MTKHFIKDDDVTAEERLAILDLALDMKRDRFKYQPLAGPKAVALLFDKPSTRTRLSFSVGVSELGGLPIVFDAQTTQAGRGEPLEDTMRVLDRQVVAIAWRTFLQTEMEIMASVSRVPVINTLTDRYHPCQVLADLLTVRERMGRLEGVTLAYFGDASNNMAHSYLLAGASAGMHVRYAAPDAFLPSPSVLATAAALASGSGGSVERFDEAKPAAFNADVLATDTWSSMGSGPLDSADIAMLRPYALTESLVDVANPDGFVLHCLPAYRGREIAAEDIDGPRSLVWEQAENRLHVQKALLTHLITGA